MADIVLATFNARYEHCSLALRSLLANMGELAPRTALLELTLDTRAPEAAEAVLALKPRVLGLGVYVWNALETGLLVRELKALRPDLVIVLGGPEVSHEPREESLCRAADFVVSGEGERVFPELCRAVLAGAPPAGRYITAPPPDPADLALPYTHYSDADIAGRLLYAEASRGCPFGCEFCLSSLDRGARYFPLERLFREWDALLGRGALRFKFVDRTFNLDPARAAAVMEFFLARMRPGLFLHFEMVPDRVQEELYPLLRRFPAGTLQLELGVQTFAPAVAERVTRRQDPAAVERNLARLLKETAAYIHADLIAGLPGEDLASFAAGFDRLYAIGPHEIQVGTLKRLRGAPIARHDAAWGMVYSPNPPYEFRRTSLIGFEEGMELRRFARHWDLVANSGVFRETAPLLCAGPSPFASFSAFSLWLHARTGRAHSIARSRLRELLLCYLTERLGVPAREAGAALERDALRAARSAKAAGRKRQALR